MRSAGAIISPQSKLVSLGSGKDDLVNVNTYPDDIRKPTDKDMNIQYTLGDLHGVWMTYLWELIKLGVITLSKTNDLAESQKNFSCLLDEYRLMEVLFNEIKRIELSFPSSESDDSTSNSGDELLSDDSDYTEKELLEKYQALIDELANSRVRFAGLIKNINVVNKDLSIVKAGDDTGDRNGCDLCMVEIDAVLIDNGMKLDKIYSSNHGFDFLVNVVCRKLKLAERSDTCLFDTILVGQENEGYFNSSLHNLGRMIRCGIVEAEYVCDLVDKYYFPRVILLDFVRDKYKNESKTFGTHAPNTSEDFAFIERIFKHFRIYQYDFGNPKSIEQCVDLVNKRFREWIKTSTFEQINEEFSDSQRREQHPIYLAMCNRKLAEVRVSEGVFFLFGHCSQIRAQFPQLLMQYKCVDNAVCKAGTNPETGEFDRAYLHVAETKSSRTPAGKVVASGEQSVNPIDVDSEVKKKKKRRQAGYHPQFFQSPAKKPQEKGVPDLNSVATNLGARFDHAKANQ